MEDRGSAGCDWWVEPGSQSAGDTVTNKICGVRLDWDHASPDAVLVAAPHWVGRADTQFGPVLRTVEQWTFRSAHFDVSWMEGGADSLRNPSVALVSPQNVDSTSSAGCRRPPTKHSVKDHREKTEDITGSWKDPHSCLARTGIRPLPPRLNTRTAPSGVHRTIPPPPPRQPRCGISRNFGF